MGNTLKVVLILIGAVLVALGLYFLISPGMQGFGPFQIEGEDRTAQIVAMIAFGILALIVGLAYKRR
ncbi:MAG TPA: hypothetical protein VFM82_02095 [Flavobacteriaceae bacterium]|nr:hypothetical protein [Flavobacteriaceae bacterium]